MNNTSAILAVAWVACVELVANKAGLVGLSKLETRPRAPPNSRRLPGTDHVGSHVMTELLHRYFNLSHSATLGEVLYLYFIQISDLYSQGGISCSAQDKRWESDYVQGAQRRHSAMWCPNLLRPNIAVAQ